MTEGTTYSVGSAPPPLDVVAERMSSAERMNPRPTAPLDYISMADFPINSRNSDSENSFSRNSDFENQATVGCYASLDCYDNV